MIGLASRIGLIPSDSTARRYPISVIVKGIVFDLFYVFFLCIPPFIRKVIAGMYGGKNRVGLHFMGSTLHGQAFSNIQPCRE